MRILITGNMGYIGPSVVDELRNSYPDATLVGFDTGYFAHCLTAAQILPESRLDLQYFGDVRDMAAEILRDIDVVVHLAAISNDPMGNAFEEVTDSINRQAGVRLARLARDAGVRRFVFASSCSIYGFAEGGPRKEDDAVNPLTAYARSKVAMEGALQDIAGDDFVCTALRFATACGMSKRVRLDLVLNDFVAAAVASHQITILSDGTPWRPLIHVEDMARAICWAVQREAGTGGAYLSINTGSNEWNYQVRHLADAVASVIPGIEISINRDAQPDRRSYRVDFGLFEELAPQHQPKVDLRGAINGLRAGLEAMNFDDRNFHQSHFMRLKVLTSLRERHILDEQLKWARRPSL